MSKEDIAVKHPAKFSRELYDPIFKAWRDNRAEDDNGWIVDPFAGVGRIHEIFRDALAIEIEPEWADQSATLGDTWCGDFFEWEPDRKISAIVTSPTYGNRMADHHDAQDGSRRNTYRHLLGRELTDNNSGAMQWGVEYRAFHIKFLNRAYEILAGGGLLILNVKNHIRKGEEIDLVSWFRKRAVSTGFRFVEEVFVPTRGLRDGANGDLRVAGEYVQVYERKKTHSNWEALRRANEIPEWDAA
jgi:hypothetical protein